MRRLLAPALACLVLLPGSADAGKPRGKVVVARQDAGAWSAARAVLPAGPNVVAQIDVRALVENPFVKQLLTGIIEKDPKVKAILDGARTQCSIDPMTVLRRMVIAVDTRARGDEGAMFFEVSGLDRDKLTACVRNVVAAIQGPGAKLTAYLSKLNGATIVEYRLTGESDPLYVAWLGPAVFAIASEPTDRAVLERMLGGKGALAANPTLAAGVARVAPDALAWAVMLGPEDFDGKEMKRLAMEIRGVAGAFDLAATFTFGSAADATALADELRRDLEKEAASSPPALARLMRSLGLTVTGPDVRLALRLSHDDLRAVIGLLGAVP